MLAWVNKGLKGEHKKSPKFLIKMPHKFFLFILKNNALIIIMQYYLLHY